jgi:hypothetical protein
VASCCECGDEPSDSCTTELVSCINFHLHLINYVSDFCKSYVFGMIIPSSVFYHTIQPHLNYVLTL